MEDGCAAAKARAGFADPQGAPNWAELLRRLDDAPYRGNIVEKYRTEQIAAIGMNRRCADGRFGYFCNHVVRNVVRVGNAAEGLLLKGGHLVLLFLRAHTYNGFR